MALNVKMSQKKPPSKVQMEKKKRSKMQMEKKKPSKVQMVLVRKRGKRLKNEEKHESAKDKQHHEQPKSTIHKGSSVLKSPFEEGSGWTTEGPQQDKALLVWNAIIEEEKYLIDIFVSLEEEIIGWEAQWNLSGDDIVKSFKLHERCKDKVMSFHTVCLKKDDDKLGSDYKGYRIFLDPKISVSVFSGSLLSKFHDVTVLGMVLLAL